MVKTKGAAAASKNWNDAISRVPGKYKEGVSGATGVIQASIEAENLYAAKVQEAIASGSRVKGLQGVTDQDWKNAAQNKGASRIGPGMAEAAPKFSRGITEVIGVIESTNIAPRSADPLANVDGRVKPIVAALAAMKRR